MLRADALLLTAALLIAQAPQPTFRSRVDLVTVDVTVVDRTGNPVTDLGPDDVIVTVEGRPRKVVSAQFVGTTTTAPETSRTTSTAAPSFSTNVSASQGRLILLVVDQANIRLGAVKSLMRTATGFLDQLQPNDRVAVVTIPAPGPTVGLTLDRARVKAALARINGFYSPRAAIHHIAVTEALAIAQMDGDVLQRVVERECPRGSSGCEFEIVNESHALAEASRRRTEDSLRSLMELFGILKTIDGPKTIVIVSEGLITELGNDRDRELATLSAQARVNLYMLRLDVNDNDASEPRNVSANDATARREGLERIAGATRGVMLTVAGDGAQIFDRVARDMSASYLVAFEPDARDRDGRPHDIKVAVRRANVTVRARRQFDIVAPSAPASRDAAIAAALRAPLPIAGLPLRIASYTFHDANPGDVRIAVAAEAGEGFKAPATMHIGYALVDSAGKVVGTRIGTTELPIAPGGSGALDYTASFSVIPGDYTLKLAVADPDGRVGSVEHFVQARPAMAGAIAISDPVVTDAGSGTNAARLPVNPIVTSGRLQASVDLRTAGTWPDRVTIRVEVAAGEQERPILMTAASLANTQDPQRRIAHVFVDTSRLEPGRYIVRTVVTTPAHPGGVTVTRAFDIARP